MGYTDALTRDDGWEAALRPAPESESLDAAVQGQYPSLTLARSWFMDSWFLDKKLLRFLVRRVFTAGDEVGEFGAFGGRYSAWLNDTGLVEAHAFDGTPGVSRLTEGQVRELQLAEPFDLG